MEQASGWADLALLLDTGPGEDLVISVELARRLRTAGLVWTPAAGDRFMVPGRGLDEESFVLSDMTVEVHDLPTGRVIGFNGTTEWALDSLELADVVWLPSEAQLRERLADHFVRLEAVEGGYVCVVGAGAGSAPDDEVRHVDLTAADAYARAVLAALEG